MYSNKHAPTSEEEHQAELRHFTTKIANHNKPKLSDAERAELKTRMYAHPAKRHSPVGLNR